jgi:hypothetical protein
LSIIFRRTAKLNFETLLILIHSADEIGGIFVAHSANCGEIGKCEIKLSKTAIYNLCRRFQRLDAINVFVPTSGDVGYKYFAVFIG